FSIVRALMGLAEIAASQRDGQRGGWLFGAADHLTPSSGSYRDAFNERVAQTRKQLDAATVDGFNAAWTEGQAATLAQARDRALHLPKVGAAGRGRGVRLAIDCLPSSSPALTC